MSLDSNPRDTVAQPFRIGLGYDSHRLGPGGPLRIGGIDIGPIADDAVLPDREMPPDENIGFHAIGHSDADVLLHAITDALLGAIAAPDIGRLFPDNAEINRGRNSADFIVAAITQVRQSGYTIGNLDAVILAQKPKMAPHIDAMRRTIATMLECPIEAVGLKAKTGEGVDAVGRCEAIAARVIVMLFRSGQPPY